MATAIRGHGNFLFQNVMKMLKMKASITDCVLAYPWTEVHKMLLYRKFKQCKPRPPCLEVPN